MPKVKTYKDRHRERYLKRQRKRALEIIAAEQQYSKPFRAEVKDALDNWPHKLEALFLEAERMDQRDTRSNKPRVRSSTRSCDVYAEKAESLFSQQHDQYLDSRMTERTKMLSQILYVAATESDIDVTHPRIVAAFIKTIMPRWHHKPFAAAALSHMRDIVDGCSDDNWQHIRDFWSDDEETSRAAQAKDQCFQLSLKEARRRDEKVTRPTLRKQADTDKGKTIEYTRAASDIKEDLERLRGRLRDLDHLPENESSRWQLETEIASLERELAAVEEWPDVIGELETVNEESEAESEN